MPLFEKDPEDEALADAPAEGQKPTEPALPEDPAPEPTTLVALPRPGRRQRAAEAVEGLSGKFDEFARTMAERDAARDRELAETRGALAVLAQRPQFEPQRHEAPPIEPIAMLKQAKELLDAGKLDDYHEKMLEAAAIAAERRIAPRLQQQQAPQGPPNELMPYFAAHPEVAMHPHHQQLLMAKNMELEARRVPPGPGRLRQVFAEVSAFVKNEQKTNGNGRPQYSPSTAAALTGVPTSRSQASNGGDTSPGVNLTSREREIARRAGMSEQRYAEWQAKLNKERIVGG